jgi:hypothetical protein
MLGQKRFSNMVRRIIGTEAVIVVFLGLLCLLVGWHIAQAFLIAGVLTLLVSCAEFFAGRNEMHCVEHQYVQMTMQVIADEDLTNKQARTERTHALIQGVILSGLTIGMGLAVAALFG